MRNAYDILSGEKTHKNCIYSIVAIMANMRRRPTRGKKNYSVKSNSLEERIVALLFLFWGEHILFKFSISSPY